MNISSSKNNANSNSMIYIKNPHFNTDELPLLLKEFLNEFSSPYPYENAKKDFISAGLDGNLFCEIFEVLFSENMILEYTLGAN